ncbi:hypothetical protein B2G94_05350 [Staphylococcus hominis subsp. hominis]|nr:hypothetical protein B7P03_05280 [Staphylococcus hominis subsp. hominis]OUL46424.1 hypothetical protein B2G94_05350 [Staphylococcus hominis subsp. hominis]
MEIIGIAMYLVHSTIPLSKLTVEMFFKFKNGNNLICEFITQKMINGGHIMAGYKSPGRKIVEYVGVVAIAAVFLGILWKNINSAEEESAGANGSLG